MGNIIALRTGYVPERPRLERHEPLVSKKEMAEIAQVTTRTIDNYVTRDGMPQGECWLFCGGGKRFYAEATMRWINEHAPRRKPPEAWTRLGQTG